MMTDDFYQALQSCVTQTRSGVSLEQCLVEHPHYAEELRPLLMAALSSPQPTNEGMSWAARRRVRSRVMANWDLTHSREESWRLPSFLPAHWAGAAAVAIAVVLVIGGAGTAAAAQGSLPGGALYPVKQLREEAGLWFATSPEEKVSIFSGYVHERTIEIQELTRRGDSAAMSAPLARLERHLSDVDQLAEESTRAPTLESSRRSIIATLDGSLVASGQSINVQQGAYPCLDRTLQILQQARDRVRAAAESISGSLSDGAGQHIATLDSFCPP